jgi:hypothetical protein
MLRFLTLFRFVLVLAALLITYPTLLQAGCGCEKPPPSASSVRPAVTYGGMPVTLFHSSLVAGQTYDVTFTAMNGSAANVSSVPAVSKRDLADGVYKAQLSVPVPNNLPLGPVGITVKKTDQNTILLSVSDVAFTVAPQPISFPTQVGEFHYQNFQFAVSRSGIAYISLNLSAVTLPMVFQAQAKGYPLRFNSNGVVFYNTQGFLMQLLNQNMPGLGTTIASSGSDSDTVHYSRHEFATFYLHHNEKQTHNVDANDANWHLNGSRHIDHDHLVLALVGTLNGTAPAAGATPAFELVVKTFSLFQHGLVGVSSISMSNTAKTDSYNSNTGLSGTDGDLRSNGTINLDNRALVDGDATASSFSVLNGSVITGTKKTTSQALNFMPIFVPSGLQNLGDIVRTNNSTYTLVGPASYKVGKIDLNNGAHLLIDNTAGPVTLYIEQYVKTTNTTQITTTDANPEKFALYMVNGGDVELNNNGIFYGVVYGPQSVLKLTNSGQFSGAFVGKNVILNNSAEVHYDTALRGE